MKIQLSQEQRDAIFPANIVLDQKLRLVAVGPTISRRFPAFTPGEKLLNHFRLTVSGQEANVEDVAGTGTMLRLRSLISDEVLRGWAIPWQSGYLLALRLAPLNYDLENSGLQITDFAADDPAVHALLMFSMQRALLEEERLVALELDHARQQSMELADRLSRAAGFMAHDFNNFLSIIMLNSERLKREIVDQPQALRLVDVIAGAAARGSAITRSLMTLSNQRDDSRIPVSLDALIEENRPFFATTVGARVRLDLDLRAAGAKTLVSPVATLNCLLNLLINARDAMPRGGCVKLSSRVEERTDVSGGCKRWVEIEVADTGQGMAKEVCDRAFDPLFSTKAHGTGLGLASVREFAVDAGGETRIVSTEGAGTRVYLNLPCLDHEAKAASGGRPDLQRSSSAPAHLVEYDRADVLVVEDEAFALEALCELLNISGFDVTGVTSGAAAMEELGRKRFKALLTDIVLPGESGAELAAQASRIDPGLKVILMSGYVPQEESLEEDWLFLRKPIDARVVTEMLRTATRA